MTGAIEWIEYILNHFEHTLRSVGIYGDVGLSCDPNHFDRDVWRAFCELWSPLINTLYGGAEEVGISLYGLERIGGLPILGDEYEEFLPRNEDLMRIEKFSPTFLELLYIHAELCYFHKSNHLSCFVLPYHIKLIRPETFIMASTMVKGQMIILAVIMLGYIYHGLEQVVSWLVEIFQALYSQHPNCKCLIEYPTLMRYAEMILHSMVDKSQLTTVEIS
ncbi:hypothetical protein Cgig2_034043 [Carnegiea gigantea]|uniref:Uncharacterized protein n=1 Tax=Carnegiea gigantea TaxID=171969 RepID=A0A9Q1QJD2_9CARY|nr:hypothetical protein Cgig2_034043 [Carnegiea gigantea]